MLQIVRLPSFCFLLLIITPSCYPFIDENELLKDVISNVSMPLDTWVDRLNDYGILATPSDRSRIPELIIHMPLFEKYPTLLETLPYVSLSNLPTPVKKGEPGNHFLAPSQLYIKSDDLTGHTPENVSRLYGGAMLRSLEFLLADALAHNSRSIMLLSNLGSHEAIATAIYAENLGFNTIGMFAEHHTRFDRHNLLWHLAHKTEFHYSATITGQKLSAITTWLDHYYHYGSFPYVIGPGFSLLAAVGFVNAAFELKKQINEGVLSEPDFIYLPCQSPSAITGLLLGCKACGLKSIIIGQYADSQEEPQTKKLLYKNVQSLNNFMRQHDPLFPILELTNNDLLLWQTETKESYGDTLSKNPEGQQQIRDKVVLVWNTIDTRDYSKQLSDTHYAQLPNCLHHYFEQEPSD